MKMLNQYWNKSKLHRALIITGGVILVLLVLGAIAGSSTDYEGQKQKDACEEFLADINYYALEEQLGHDGVVEFIALMLHAERGKGADGIENLHEEQTEVRSTIERCLSILQP